MTKFVILGMQRTGTSWIETLLDSHPNIRCLGEIFYFSKGRFPFIKPRGRRTELSYRRYIEYSLNRKVCHYIAKAKMVNNCLDQLYDVPNYSAIGFKLMYDQARQFPMIIDYFRKQNVKIIHVVRNNVLKTLVSLVASKKRRLVHTTENVRADKVYLHITLLFWRLKKIDKQNKFWINYFADYEANYFKIEYEELLRNFENEQEKLLRFFGIGFNFKLTSQLKKINPDKIGNILINYGEVKKCLEYSQFGYCLD